ncbi:MarR family transcriptional regulator [Pusillimonas sp. CC-YST705]|uniref:MarR family transcriptional regulator n=1 Tax=Mesopusillimonas faecipullorum TaxID=2755040 RepID=A0ABS8CCW3_9BURK|nr:MarR family transcriptional regulator [Mesopusillimonas faecipullorum]MCB5363858.1 MarR family transcriptional regulator [Mesopusillimonas faecipullorum]
MSKNKTDEKNVVPELSEKKRRVTRTPRHASTLSKEFDMLDDSLGYIIKRAQVRTYEVLFGLLGSESITPGRMTALCLVAKQPGISQSELAEMLSITRAAVVKVVDTLETRGFVQRQSIPDNRRTYALAVTPEGYDELRRLTRLSRQYEKQISARLSVDERKQLMALLQRVAL